MKLIIRQYNTNLRLVVRDGGRNSLLVNNEPEIIKLVLRQGDFTVIGAGASVTSASFTSLAARVSGNSAQMTSADNALYNAVSVISQQVSVLSARVESNSAQMVSADNAISNAVSVVSAAAALKNPILTIIDDGVTVLSSPASFDFVGAGVQVSVSGTKAVISIAAGAAASVTSAEYLSLVDRVSGNSAQMTSADTALYQAVSVLSQQVSVLSARVTTNSAQMTSADDAISNAVSIVSAAQAATSAAVTSVNQVVSVISQQVSVLSARVDSNSAQMTSADNAISNAVSVVSAAQAATSAEVTSVRNRLSAVSADFTSFKASINNFGDVSTSSPTSAQVLVYVSLTGQWVNAAQTAASVTSAEYLSLVNRVSTNSAQMTSADNAISNAVSIVSAAQAVTSAAVTSVNQVISVISQQVSVLSQQVSVLSARVGSNSAQMTSADNAISNAVSIVSAAQATTSAAVTSVNQVVSVLSQQISVISQQVSVLSARVESNSAQMTSADNAISNAVSVVSAAAALKNLIITVIDEGVTTLSNPTAFDFVGAGVQVSVSGSKAVVSIGGGGAASVTSAEYTSLVDRVSANSAQMTSADNAISNAVSIVSAAQASTQSVVSTLQWMAVNAITSATYSVQESDKNKLLYFNNTASIEVILPDGLTSGFQAVVYRNVSAGVLRFSATTSVEAQGSALNDNRTAATIYHRGSNLWLAIGAFLPAELGTLSNQISVLSQAVSVLSQSVSVLSVTVAANAATTRVVTDSQGISATTFASANSKISGLSISMSAGGVYHLDGMILLSNAATLYRFGLSTSATTFQQAAGIWRGIISIAPTTVSGNSVAQTGTWNQGSFGSVSFSAIGTTGIVLGATLTGVVVTSTTGGNIQVKALASAAATAITILKGSYIKAFKIG